MVPLGFAFGFLDLKIREVEERDLKEETIFKTSCYRINRSCQNT